MILILGGTTEGRIAVRTLEEAGKPFYYSTKGDEQAVPLHNGIRLQGAMDENGLESFCRQHGISLLIDAAHPFAEQLHRTVSGVAAKLHIPAIRYERIFPDLNKDYIIWCNSYQDAIHKIKKEEIHTLLALTGVQSIGKLKTLWQKSCHCYFRILDRESSRKLARQQEFPEESLYYYHAKEDERLLMHRLRPDAILIKESGVSGGFPEKVEAAHESGIRIFAIKRPRIPGNFIPVNGEHGLRRMVEKYLPAFYPLHSGLTTGTCATAAAVAAVWGMYNTARQPRPEEFPVVLPDGETISVPVEKIEKLPHSNPVNGIRMLEAAACVIKDAGDDPDITDGMQIWANAAVTSRDTTAMSVTDNPNGKDMPLTGDYNVIIAGGKGVGTVTMPGLGLEPGAPAINATPRKMIEENVKMYLEQLHIPRHPAAYTITISVPGGEEIAKRTFNPRLGVEGGISIIGTSGIVKPFSTEAFVSSIRKSMEVARATGSPRIVISSGAKSERYIKAYYPELPAQAFVHYGNFIGETLKIAGQLGLPHVTLGVMIGKAVKLAEGNLDTHSKKVTMNKEFIRKVARQAGCGEDVTTAIRQMNLARELWNIIPAEKTEAFSRLLIEHCRQCCASLLPNGELTILLISEDGKIYV